MASTLTNVLGGGVFDGVAKIISLFKIPPQVQADNQIELQKIQQEILDRTNAYAQAQIDDATKNIQAEAAQGSKARPLFMYIIESILLYNYLFARFLNAFYSGRFPTMDLPTNLLLLFGVCLTGYTAFDKVKELMALPGDSNISFLGVKVGNKN